MTLTQISYFLEVARCLNFTEAAKHLYITQPTLSRQITAIEAELNMQLFIRNQKSLKLTPGGIILRDELGRMMEDYQQILEKAERASRGMSGSLRIGVLEGHGISEILPDVLEYFEHTYPNIKIYLGCYSYRELIDLLYSKEIDAIITYDFHVREKDDILTIPVQQVSPVLAMPRRNPLADKENIQISDLENESLVIVNEQECSTGVDLVRHTCSEYGGFYPDFYFVDTMEDAILWVEAGMKSALFNTGMNIMENKSVKIVEFPQLPPMNVVLGWYQKNDNEALSLLLDYYKK